MGRIKNDWQDRDHLFKWFGSSKREARKAYRGFVGDSVRGVVLISDLRSNKFDLSLCAYLGKLFRPRS